MRGLFLVLETNCKGNSIGSRPVHLTTTICTLTALRTSVKESNALYSCSKKLVTRWRKHRCYEGFQCIVVITLWLKPTCFCSVCHLDVCSLSCNVAFGLFTRLKWRIIQQIGYIWIMCNFTLFCWIWHRRFMCNTYTVPYLRSPGLLPWPADMASQWE